MDRVEFLASWWGLVVLALVTTLGVMRFTRRRWKRDAAVGDPFLPEAEAGIDPDEAGAERPGIFPDFAALLEGFVLPRHQAYPGWDRLDGAMGVKGRPLAWFDHHGTVYGVNGETRFAPLLAARDWLAAHPGEDPLTVQPSRRGAGRLTLRPEVGWAEPRDLRIETG